MVGPSGDTAMLVCPTLNTIGLWSFHQAQTGEWLGKHLHFLWGQAGPFHWSTCFMGVKSGKKTSIWQQGIQVMLSLSPHTLAAVSPFLVDRHGPSGTDQCHSSQQTAQVKSRQVRRTNSPCFASVKPFQQKFVKASGPSGLHFSLSTIEIIYLDYQCPLAGIAWH